MHAVLMIQSKYCMTYGELFPLSGKWGSTENFEGFLLLFFN